MILANLKTRGCCTRILTDPQVAAQTLSAPSVGIRLSTFRTAKTLEMSRMRLEPVVLLFHLIFMSFSWAEELVSARAAHSAYLPQPAVVTMTLPGSTSSQDKAIGSRSEASISRSAFRNSVMPTSVRDSSSLDATSLHTAFQAGRRGLASAASPVEETHTSTGGGRVDQTHGCFPTITVLNIVVFLESHLHKWVCGVEFFLSCSFIQHGLPAMSAEQKSSNPSSSHASAWSVCRVGSPLRSTAPQKHQAQTSSAHHIHPKD